MPNAAFTVKLELNGQVIEEVQDKGLFLKILQSIHSNGGMVGSGLAGHVPLRPEGSTKPKPRSVNSKTEGPTAVLRKMVEMGFFSKARTGREAQQQARDKYRALISTNNVHGKLGDLVRLGLLDRVRGSDGVFRYSVARTVIATDDSPSINEETLVQARSEPKRQKRAGAQSLLRKLLEDGYFSKLCSSKEVRAHVKHTFGHLLTTKETPKALLRLVHEGRLTREMGPKGEYLYRATRSSEKR